LPQARRRPQVLEEFAGQHHFAAQEPKLEQVLVRALVQQQVLLLQQVEQK
jgi:replication-associated recombination protein RarA